MSLLCDFFGHKFVHDTTGVTGTWSRQFVGSKAISDWYRTLHVPKECTRCGYRHSDSFVVPEAWMDKPEAGRDG